VFQFSKKIGAPVWFLTGETKIERKKKNTIVLSPTQSITFSVGATEIKLEPAATETTVIHRYQRRELLMLFCHLHQ